MDLSEQDHFRFRPNASSGKALVVYRLTKLHKASFVVSLLSFAGVLSAVLFRWKRCRKKALKPESDPVVP